MRIVLFALLAVVLLASCEDKTKYTLEVLVSDASEDTQVVLYEDRRGRNPLETVSAVNGKFIFEGKADDAVIRFIGVEGKRELLPVVLESGQIKVSIADISSVTGTPLNDRNYAFWQEKGYNSTPDVALLLTFINENTDNVLGTYHIDRYTYMLGLDQMKETLDKFSVKFDSDSILNRVREYVKVQDATSVGQKFTDIKSLTPAGEEIALSDYAGKGKYVLIDFWASWCPPCRADMPNVVAVYEKYKDKGFEILGVSLDMEKEAWEKGIKDLNITWPQMSDLKYWGSEPAQAYGVRSIPATVLLDGEGNIIAKGLDGKELDAKLEELFK